MEIQIEGKPYSIVKYFLGRISEEEKIWEFSLTEFNDGIEIYWPEDIPPNHEEVENDIKNQFNIWNK